YIAPGVSDERGPIRTARHEPVVPTPAILALRPDLAAIHRDEVEANPALAKRFSQGWPYDAAWVSVTGTFDMSSMLDELTKLPPEWWERDSSWGFADVMMERQIRQPDGTWSEAELVPPMPGVEAAGEIRRMHQPGFLPAGDAATAKAWFKYIHENQSVILTPVFWELANATWAPADPQDRPVDIEGEVGRVRELNTQIRQQELVVRRLNQQLQQRTQQASKIKQRIRPGATRPGATDTDSPSGGTRPAPPVGPNRAVQRLREKLQAETQALQALEQEYRERTGQDTGGAGRRPAVDPTSAIPEVSPPDPRRPRRPGGNRLGRPGGIRPPGAGALGGRDAAEAEPDEAEIKQANRLRRLKKFGATDEGVIKMYANDLGAQPGKTYRYRLRVAVINPLYLRLIDLPEEQEEKNKDRPLLYSGWSDWSREVTIERLNHFFVRSAQRDHTADVEVWRFYHGKWRNQEFKVAAGAPIGGPAEIQLEGNAHPMDFFTDAHVVDMELLQIPGKIRNTTRNTTRVLLMRDGELLTRRLDHDRDHPKRQWLQIQQQRGGGGIALRTP
ncbi:MAG: hypothetical protein OER86_07920, partial [Phycisphaerae bacterium]|nr:hypothetical protein [Phycisphaerae bacterium]